MLRRRHNPGSDAAEELSVSAETWPGGSGEPGPGWPIWHPAYRWRCHIEDGPAISPATLHMIGCDATISLMVHDADGNVIAVGDRTRKPSAKLRRAVRERDRYRCRFPGCESRRVDIHHIVYWSNGGKTRLDNLISGDGFGFYTRNGLPLRASPPLPQPAGGITACHDVTITPTTIIPPQSGERLNLNLAIWIAFANARIKAERRQREHEQPPHTKAAAQ